MTTETNQALQNFVRAVRQFVDSLPVENESDNFANRRCELTCNADDLLTTLQAEQSVDQSL
jgi:hypothetical protein